VDTWETINNPRSVFLYQLPKQAIEKMPQQLSQEFLDWYQGAIAEGIVHGHYVVGGRKLSLLL
jgi:hypothetical protein